MKHFLLVILLLTGCDASLPPTTVPIQSPVFGKMPRQDEAVSLLWYGVFGMEVEPPTIEWVWGEKCKTLDYPAIYTQGICAGGTFTAWKIQIVYPWWQSDFRSFYSSTALVHELIHAKLQVETGNLDPDHSQTTYWNMVFPTLELLNDLNL